MAPPTSTISLATTSTRSDNSSFPFIKLPAELRFKIYRFALQATIDSVMLEPIYPTYRGTLALLHVNKMLRFESARELLPIAQAEQDRCEEFCTQLDREAQAAFRQGSSFQGTPPSEADSARSIMRKFAIEHLRSMLGMYNADAFHF